MGKKIMILMVAIMVSMFYFPFEFTFLPGMNTKKLLAAIGLVVFCFSLAKRRKSDLPWPVPVILGLAIVVSIAGMSSLSYNVTNDDSYSSYLSSTTVWLSAAYVTCKSIKALHGKLTMPIVIRYLVGVCVFQCIMALVIDNNAVVAAFVDRFVAQGQAVLREMDRLYGIGASLDVAGSRFSAVLIMLAFLMRKERDEEQYGRLSLYFLSFLLIVVIGSMIARTTYVGAIMSLLVIVFDRSFWRFEVKNSSLKFVGLMIFIIVALVIASVSLYNSNPRFYNLFRFAFEGFFNLVETGEWSVASNDVLETMYVWPDNLKTWLIGDGYFNNPNGNINYIGDSPTGGYYMGTDVGYCRFIFYFGIVGLLAISAVMAYAAFSSAKRLPKYRVPILLVLLANFVIWLKVSTDLFPALALIFCVAMLVGEADEEEDEEEGSEEALE